MMREKFTKKNIIIIVAVVVILSVCGIAGVLISKSETKKNEETKLTKIEFPEYMGPINVTDYEDNIDYSNIANQEINNQYLKIERTNDDKVINKIISIVGFDSIEKEKNGDFEIMRKGDALLRIYKDGSIMYTSSDRNTDEIMISDEECIQMAEKFLKENEIIDDSYQCSGVGYDLFSSMDDLENERKISKTVYFKYTYEGVEVYGTSINLTYNSKGEITGLYVLSSMKTEKVDYKTTITAKDAVERAKNHEGTIRIPDECNKVVLEKIEMIYWEELNIVSDNYTLQPVYKITGTAYNNGIEVGDYIAYESALY